jgi:hypothetical protein
MTTTKKDVLTWLTRRYADEQMTALVVTHAGDEVLRLEPGSDQWAKVDETEALIDGRCSAHARGLSVPGFHEYTIEAVGAAGKSTVLSFWRVGWLDPKKLAPATEEERCARVVDRLEQGRTIVEIVQEMRLTLEYVLRVHAQWEAARKATPKKPAA